MASTKPGPAINLEEDAEGDSVAVDDSIFIPEATSLLVCYSPFDDSDIDCNPYFPFSGLISDSGSGSYSDSEPDPYICPIDFFDRESSEVEASEYLESEGLTSGDFNIWGFYDPKEDEDEIVLGTRCLFGSGSGSVSDQQPGEQGLRVTGIDSDSDYDDDVFGYTSEDSGNRANDSGRVEVGTGLPPVWDDVFGEETVLADEEWEEVQNAINWTVRAFGRPEEEEEEEEEEGEDELSSVSRDDDDEEQELDWQVLLTVNNVVNYIEQAEGILINPDDIDPSYYLYLASLDEYDENHSGHYDADAILGQMFDNEAGIWGNPPAAKSVIEDLPVVELTVEELNKGNNVCAVCKDEIVVEEKVRRLPCSHFYHGDCIMPWLGIRNTCPVCRYELPTDDLEYERHKSSQRSDAGLARNLPGRHS
ncbi:PREDICTED: E3 ubiquitin-protein ligase Praja-2-like [Camelina sativa]|uniref:RING-type E3 ubiquitin transferase n=1 Tax=Camelina sativa TaxID=90675 RepID=A0ABM0WPW5_CAMSA|nr:PREDICTED: E3 ubiquitin-protein ligase Praja-2-like [Camelina sativa]